MNQPKFEESGSVCGFWRRIVAFVIDISILGIIGLVLGAIGFDFFATIGIYGRLIGFTIALLYFGLANSSKFSGQTIGKKILKIQVVDSKGETITVPKSFLRYIILALPFFLNGAPFSPEILQNKLFMIVLGFVVFFMGGTILYLYIFNRKTRQSLHDVVSNTFVVNFESRPTNEAIWKGHFISLGIFLVIFLIAITIFLPRLAKKQFFQDLQSTQLAIQESGLVEYSTISAGKTWSSDASGNSEFTYCAINAKLNHRPENFEKIIFRIAKIVLNTYQPIYDKSSLTVNAIYGYDIGIASGWKSQSQSHSPKEWEQILSEEEIGKKSQ